MPKNIPYSKPSLAREYRDNYGMEMPTMTLAKIMYKKHPEAFLNLEDARHALRRIEGKASGSKTKVTHPHGDRPRNPYNLPASDEREWTPFILSGVKKAGILCDVHVPYHSISAITPAIDKFINSGIDCLILNGDIIDCYSLSRFERDPRKRGFSDELDMLSELIQSLKDALKCRIIYKTGNHEDRYDHFLMRKAPELFGMNELTIESLIKSRVGNDIEIVNEKRIIQANALDIIHGHEFTQGFFSPVNVARGLALRAKTNAVQGHNHQTSEHTEKDLRGEIKTTWSIACCCELHPEYMPINKWNHGFAELELSQNSNEFRFDNYRVRDGKIL